MSPLVPRTIMNPPPPMFPAAGFVTASANAVATAASTAFPPCASTPAPASHDQYDVQTTVPSLATTPRSGCCDVPVGEKDRTRTIAMSTRFIHPSGLVESKFHQLLKNFASSRLRVFGVVSGCRPG